ncbi:hypothetical protein O3M35_007379 [Rhynocoris fuscipes]|uniref:Phosphatidylinositol-glycan biosynthesis class F protein n=1 Tax=Rhynocoris fuscipes TaxID=488301 RepID=A0AAW1DCV5_9HEMI
MKLLSSDEEIFRKASIFYSSISALILSLVVLVLLRSETYLIVGSLNIYPLFLFLIVFEVCKWCFLVILFKKDLTVNKISVFVLLYKSMKFTDFPRTVFILFISCTVYYIIIVLFGAEIFNKIEETLMLSILITLLTAMPVSLQLGSCYFENFIQGVRPENIFQSLLFYSSRATLFGGWLGAFVIPLDWDRPWQAWPIPCFLGALFGYVICNCLYFVIILAMKRQIISKKGYYVLNNLGIDLLKSEINRDLQE